MAEDQGRGRTGRARTQRALAALGAALLIGSGIVAQTGEPASAVQNPTACQPAVNLVNGDFEQPVLAPRTYRIMNQSLVPGWQTTATDSAIELWSTGFNGVPSYSGNQFAELNANQVSQLYQLVPTIPGTIIHWRLRHRGRAGTDVMVMRIGNATQGRNSPIVGSPMSDGTSAWGTYSGTYVVPPGQTMTHLGFDSISAAGGASIGNFLDDIFIGTSPCVVATKSVLDANGAPIAAMTNVNVGDVLTYRINAVNPGGDVATATVMRDSIPAGTTYVPGSLRVLTGPNAGAKTDAVDGDQGSVVGRDVTVFLGTGATGAAGGRLPNDDTLAAGTTVELKVRVATSAAGPLTNTATVSFVDLYDNAVHTATTNDVRVNMPASDLAVTKAADVSASTGVVEPGDPLHYTMTVTNNGPDAVVGARFVDPVPDGLTFGTWSCVPSSACGTTSGNGAITTDLRLAVGERATLTLAATVRAGATDSTVDNTASASTPSGVNDPDRTNDSATADLTMSNPVLGLAKTVRSRTDPDGDGVVSRGDQLTYQFVVTNNGNKALSAVSVTDPLSGLSAISCPGTTLAVGGSMICSATYVVTQADVDAGTVDNRASARAITASGVPATSASSAAHVGVPQRPVLGLAKTLGSYDDADADHTVSRGDTLVYRFAVTNDGNVTLHGMDVHDALSGLSAIVCPLTILPPGSVTSCSATRVVTQADVDRGSITNTADAVAIAPSGSTVTSPSSTVTVPLAQHPGISLTKRFSGLADVDGDQRASVDDLLTYRFDVTDTGNVTLTDIVVRDAMTGLSAVQCASTTLAPGVTVACSASAPVTQAWIDAGQVVNQATVHATPPSGPPIISPSSSVTVPLAAVPQVSLAKSLADNDDADDDGSVSRGDRLTFRLVVTNTGNVTLHDVGVTDPLPGLTPVVCPLTGTLAPRRSMTCTTTYLVTQSTVDAGSLVNTAIAHGTPPTGDPVDSSEAGATVPVPQHPSLTLHKTVRTQMDADSDGHASVGDTLQYRFQVTNTGDVTLRSVAITDTLDGLSAVDCPASTLAPAAVVTCAATYVVRQNDVEAGRLTNTASASALSPAAAIVSSAPDAATTTFERTPGISLRKSIRVDGEAPDAAGDVVAYELLVTNTGNVRLDAIDVVDPLQGLSPVRCPLTSLAPHASTTCTATYQLRQADVDTGLVHNTASVSAHTGYGEDVDGSPSSATLTLVPVVALSLIKTVASVSRGDVPSLPTVGSTLNYRFALTNSGNVTLRAVSVTDAMSGLSAIACPSSTLAPGERIDCTATYRVSRFDTARIWVTNTASARATSPAGASVGAVPSTARIQTVETSEPSNPVGPAPTTAAPTTTLQPAPTVPALTDVAAVLSTAAPGAEPADVTIPVLDPDLDPGTARGTPGSGVEGVQIEGERSRAAVAGGQVTLTSQLALTGSPSRHRVRSAVILVLAGIVLVIASRRLGRSRR